MKTRLVVKGSLPLIRAHPRGRNEQGFVLVVALLALLVVTLIGVLALSTSTTEVMIAGNARLREMILAAADAGLTLSEPVVRNPDINRYPFLTEIQEQNLKNEIYCKSQMNSDPDNFSTTIGGSNVNVDIDFSDASEPSAGYALEEGSPPIVMKNYVMNSTSTGGVASESVVGALYFIIGYCE